MIKGRKVALPRCTFKYKYYFCSFVYSVTFVSLSDFCSLFFCIFCVFCISSLCSASAVSFRFGIAHFFAALFQLISWPRASWSEFCISGTSITNFKCNSALLRLCAALPLFIAAVGKQNLQLSRFAQRGPNIGSLCGFRIVVSIYLRKNFQLYLSCRVGIRKKLLKIRCK